MNKNLLSKPSFNKGIKTALIIVFFALILSFLYLVLSPILKSSHKRFVFGDNLPVTSPNNIVVVIDVNDLEGGDASASLSAILMPAK